MTHRRLINSTPLPRARFQSLQQQLRTALFHRFSRARNADEAPTQCCCRLLVWHSLGIGQSSVQARCARPPERREEITSHFRPTDSMQSAKDSMSQPSSRRRTASEVIGESGTPPMQRSLSPQQILRCRPGSGESDASAFTSSGFLPCL